MALSTSRELNSYLSYQTDSKNMHYLIEHILLLCYKNGWGQRSIPEELLLCWLQEFQDSYTYPELSHLVKIK